MEYQIDARNHRSGVVRIGVDNQQVATFSKAGFFIYNLRGQVDGLDYHFKLAAPWNGFRFWLLQNERQLASAKKKTRMHAFDVDRPLIRHYLVEFQVDIDDGRTLILTPEDRHGLTYRFDQNGEEVGRLAMRSFDAQREGEWQADLKSPDDWTVPLAAFAGWIAREGRSTMSS